MSLFTKDRIGGIFLLLFCLLYGWKIGDIKLLPFQAGQAFTPRTIPEILSVLGIGLSILIIVMPGNRDRLDLSGLNWPLGLGFLVLMSFYGLMVRPAGFILSTSLFLMIGFTMLGERNPIKLIMVAVPLVLIFWALMNYGLDVFVEPLPVFLRG